LYRERCCKSCNATAVSLSTPGGTQWAHTVAQTVTLANPADPFSVQTLAVEATTNGNRATVVYDGSTRTTAVITPEGRKAAVTIDSTGRVTAEQLGNRTPVEYTYDARGRLSQVIEGARTTTLTYNPSGFVDTLTDPLGRTTAFEYDAAGRVTRQTLPDGRGIGFVYDADGNLTGLTPPGRARHHLRRRLQGDLRAYEPPRSMWGSRSRPHTPTIAIGSSRVSSVLTGKRSASPTTRPPAL
jgi:YD repeat-containing protein